MRDAMSFAGTMRVGVVESPCAGPTATTVTHPRTPSVPLPGVDAGGCSSGYTYASEIGVPVYESTHACQSARLPDAGRSRRRAMMRAGLLAAMVATRPDPNSRVGAGK